MSAYVTHQFNQAALREMLHGPNGAVARDMLRRGLRVESAAKRNLQSSPRRVDTGRLLSSITTTITMVNGDPAARVGTDVSYAIFVHNGTGIHGPHGQPIRPVNKRVLRWRGPGGDYVFAKSSRGMVPNPFLTNALHAARG